MKRRFGLGTLAVPSVLLLSGGLLATGASRAAAAPAALACGANVTTSVTLTSDIGPCTGDGLDVFASGVTINLAGHTITGSDTTNTTLNEQVGIRLINVSGVTVAGPGTVTHFDAGVAILGGKGNTVKKLNVTGNIAHVLLTGGDPTTGVTPDLPYPINNQCNFGDGITTDGSNANIITQNTATNNGPFSGISLVNSSSKNFVNNNTSSDNNVSNIIPGPPIPGDDGNLGPCGPFQAAVGVGRPHQDIGIRAEGPGAVGNVIASNTVSNNQLEGIAIFDNICPTSQALGGPPATPANDSNVVQSNTVTGNGFADGGNHGIAVLQQGPGGIVCVPSFEKILNNISSQNSGNGIFMGGRGSHNNVVVGNTVEGNHKDGIHVTGPSSGRSGPLPGSVNNTLSGNVGHTNALFDGFDGNPNCDNNKWSGNTLTKVNMPCIH